MFSGLGEYIEDTHPLELPGQANAEGDTSDGLFFSVPPVNVESAEYSTTGQPKADDSEAVDIGQAAVMHSDETDQPGAKDPATSEETPSEPNSQEATAQQGQPEANVMYKVWFPILDLSPPPTDTGKKKKAHKLSKSEAEDTLQKFVDARNLFAFLDRIFLVATQTTALPYEIFTKIYKRLQLSFSDQDMNATSKMFMAESHLQTYMDEVGLDDVRNDDDKILEGLTLGERWKSTRLYHEAFLHAVGRWDDIRHHPAWDLITQTTKSRIDRASIDLVNLRLSNIQQRIPNFEFPSVWLGAGKYNKYSGWKNGYDRMRSFTMSYYKHFYGSWPPKAGKKGKGGGYTETGGLNRLVLKQLYDDLCCVYDLLVDREWIHGEQIHFQPGQTAGSDGEKSDEGKDEQEEGRKALRTVEEEFNTAYMPVVPGIPFDVPKLPYRLPASSGASKKKSKSLFGSSNGLSGDELSAVLNYSYNQDALEEYGKTNQFVSQFIQMEREWGSGKKIEDSADARRGRWIFMYCVLQSLPMTVVDGTGLRHGGGVEYFLCENVKGAAPWDKGRNNRQSRMSMWMPTSGPDMFGSTSNLASNPDDEIDNTFRRSHCWLVAEAWRMVQAEEGEEEFYEEDYETLQYGGSMDGSGYLPEQPYQAGHDIPISPRMSPNSNGQGQPAQYLDRNVSGEYQRMQANEEAAPDQSSRVTSQSYDPNSPAWAQEARQNHYAQPRYSPAPSNPYDQQQYGHERSMSNMSRHSHQSRTSQPSQPSQPSRNSSLPTSPLEHTPEQNASLPPLNELQPLQLQPFEFDLKPLEITKSNSPTQSPIHERSQSPPMQSPPLVPVDLSQNQLYPTHRDIDNPTRSPVGPVQSLAYGRSMSPPMLSPPLHSPPMIPGQETSQNPLFSTHRDIDSPSPPRVVHTSERIIPEAPESAKYFLASPTFGKDQPEEGHAF